MRNACDTIKYRRWVGDDAPTARLLAAVRGQAGDGVVGFALALPVFLGMIFGLIEVGRVMYANDALSNATRAAVRYAIVRGSTSESPATTLEIADTLRSQATALLPANLQVTTTFVPDNNPGSMVTVQAIYTHDYLLPFLPLEQITLRSESTMTVAR